MVGRVWDIETSCVDVRFGHGSARGVTQVDGAAYVVTAALVDGYLGLSTLRDRVAGERVVTATAPPASAPAHERHGRVVRLALRAA
jgi:hypothetical protein